MYTQKSARTYGMTWYNMALPQKTQKTSTEKA